MRALSEKEGSHEVPHFLEAGDCRSADRYSQRLALTLWHLLFSEPDHGLLWLHRKELFGVHTYGSDQFSKAAGLNCDVGFEDWLAQMGADYLRERPLGLPRGLIHADVFWDNVIYLNGEFQALIDFEDACNYFYVYDLASALFGTCVDAGKLDLEKATQIIKGYEQIRVLEEDERRALQLFSVYSGVVISYWRYMKYNLNNPTEENKNLHKRTAEIADGIRAIPAKMFHQVFI